MIDRRVIFVFFVALVMLAGSYRYVPFSLDFESTVGEATDGFKVQIAYVIGLYEIGSLFPSMWGDNLLIVHFFRWITVWPFMEMESVTGKLASLFMLEILLLPLVMAIPKRVNPLLAALPLLLPLAISGRAVLVSIAIGYLFLYLSGHSRRRVFLIAAVLFSNLSSASVLTCLLLVIFWRSARGGGFSFLVDRIAAIVFLAASLTISLLEKRYGFSVGSSGYEAYSNAYQDNIFLTLVSRATIFVSFADGNYIRGVVYLLAGLFLVYKLAVLSLQPGRRHIQVLLLCCFPGVMLEGLGVVALFFPCFWLLIGALTPPAAVPVLTSRFGVKGATIRA